LTRRSFVANIGAIDRIVCGGSVSIASFYIDTEILNLLALVFRSSASVLVTLLSAAMIIGVGFIRISSGCGPLRV